MKNKILPILLLIILVGCIQTTTNTSKKKPENLIPLSDVQQSVAPSNMVGE